MPSEDSLEEALIAAEEKARQVLGRLPGPSSNYTIVVKVGQGPAGYNLVIDIEVPRARSRAVEYLVEEAIDAARREFERRIRSASKGGKG